MYYSHTQARAKLPKKRRRVVNTSAISEARKNRRNRSESKKMSLTKLGIVSRHGELVSARSSSIYALQSSVKQLRCGKRNETIKQILINEAVMDGQLTAGNINYPSDSVLREGLFFVFVYIYIWVN